MTDRAAWVTRRPSRGDQAFVRIYRWWSDHQIWLLRLAILLMLALSALKLGIEFRRLILDVDPTDAVDLKTRYAELHQWFSGVPIYRVGFVAYPPATYVILWPMLGWLPLEASRWLWALTTLGALAWFAYLIVRESGATTRTERLFVALMFLSMGATGTAIGTGQLTIISLVALMAGLILLHRRGGSWTEDVLAAALFLIALVKPTIALPFVWIVLFVPCRLRPAVLVALGYAALTALAASFQQAALPILLRDALVSGSAIAAERGYADLHLLLSQVGLRSLAFPASLLSLVALGAWTYRNRNIDFWLLVAIAALVARLWTYHRVYDDVLILLPMVALFRIAKSEQSTRSAWTAGALLAITLASMLVPGGLLQAPPPWDSIVATERATVWIMVLIFLLNRARRLHGSELSRQRELVRLSNT